MTADEWNAKYPVGTSVCYYPVMKPGIADCAVTKTRSEAWTLGSGDVVVMLENMSGGKSIDHLTIAITEPVR
jgi:hypothetical protein